MNNFIIGSYHGSRFFLNTSKIEVDHMEKIFIIIALKRYLDIISDYSDCGDGWVEKIKVVSDLINKLEYS